MYVKELLESGRFDITKSDGVRIRPSIWLDNVKTEPIGEEKEEIEQMNFLKKEKERVVTPLGDAPYHMRHDLMSALFISGVVSYESNGLGKLNAMKIDDGFELESSGIYRQQGKAAYKKEDVLLLAQQLGYMANVRAGVYDIPPALAMNVLGQHFKDDDSDVGGATYIRRKASIAKGFGSFVSLSQDITAWPLEALLIDLVKLKVTEYTPMYAQLVRVLMLLIMSGMCEQANVDLDEEGRPSGYEIRVLGEYSNNSLAQRPLSITYDAQRVKYVAKFVHFLEYEIDRLNDDDDEIIIDKIQQQLVLSAYNILELPVTSSAWVLEVAKRKIIGLIKDMAVYSDDLRVVMRLLEVKKMRIMEQTSAFESVLNDGVRQNTRCAIEVPRSKSLTNLSNARKVVVKREVTSNDPLENSLSQRLYGFEGGEEINPILFGNYETSVEDRQAMLLKRPLVRRNMLLKSRYNSEISTSKEMLTKDDGSSTMSIQEENEVIDDTRASSVDTEQVSGLILLQDNIDTQSVIINNDIDDESTTTTNDSITRSIL